MRQSASRKSVSKKSVSAVGDHESKKPESKRSEVRPDLSETKSIQPSEVMKQTGNDFKSQGMNQTGMSNLMRTIDENGHTAKATS